MDNEIALSQVEKGIDGPGFQPAARQNLAGWQHSQVKPSQQQEALTLWMTLGRTDWHVGCRGACFL